MNIAITHNRTHLIQLTLFIMYSSIATVLTTFIFLLAGTGVTRVISNTVDLASFDCVVYAKTVLTWHENATSRYRANWEINKAANDNVRKKLFKKWSGGKGSKFWSYIWYPKKLNYNIMQRYVNNVQAYYYNGVTPSGSWIIGSNERIAGDSAHSCLLWWFRGVFTTEATTHCQWAWEWIDETLACLDKQRIFCWIQHARSKSHTDQKYIYKGSFRGKK